MNQKDLIKWGLVALGAYLIYKYIQDHGGLESLLGSTASGGTGTKTAAQIAAEKTAAAGTTISPAPTTTTTPPAPAVLDMTGLTVAPDINDSLTGVVKINGVPTRLSIIVTSGEIYDSTGADVTATLQAQGVDLDKLRTAFVTYGATPNPGVTGLGAMLFTPPWLM